MLSKRWGFIFPAMVLFAGICLFVYYLGVSGRTALLVTGEKYKQISSYCHSGDSLCVGWTSVMPIIGAFWERIKPLSVYLIFSMVVYGLIFAVRWIVGVKDYGKFEVGIPVILGASLFGLWLLFWGLSLGKPRLMFEPKGNVDGVQLASVHRDFADLKARGCLAYQGQTGGGDVGVYTIEERCVQIGFFTRILWPLILGVFFVFEILVLGRSLFNLALHKLKLDIGDLDNNSIKITELVISMGLGIVGWTVILWLMALLSLYKPVVGWILMGVVPIAGFSATRYYWGEIFSKKNRFTVSLRSITPILVFILFSVFALNLLGILRPFPIGWDDLGTYLNRAKLLVSYGKFIHPLPAFQWEYLTSLGYLLFGESSSLGITMAMVINYLAGVFATLVVYAIGRVFLGGGVVSAMFYYLLPMVQFFSFEDMKIDNAPLIMIGLSIFSLLVYLRGRDKETKASTGFWLGLAGVFAGFAFAFKSTAIMTFFALVVLLSSETIGILAGVGMVFLSLAGLSLMQVMRVEAILARIFASNLGISEIKFAIVAVFSGLVFIGASLWRVRRNLRARVVPVAIFLGTFLISVFPWVYHNNLARGKILPGPELSYPDFISPIVYLGNGGDKFEGQQHRLHKLPPELSLDLSHPACRATAEKEELGRYSGFDSGIGHYLSLPWRMIMNLDSVGFYLVTTPIFLLLPLMFFMPFFWSAQSGWLRRLAVITSIVMGLWILLADGIPWYGISMFLGFAIGVEVLVCRSTGRLAKGVFAFLAAVALFLLLAFRIGELERQKGLIDYHIGKYSGDTLIEGTFPGYKEVAATVYSRYQSNPQRPFVYRVGTSIPYFIPRNLEVVGINDLWLDTFNCINQEKDHKLTLKRLEALGFNSVIFDLNVATIEKDPRGTLHKKADEMVSFLNDPSLGMKVVMNNPQVGMSFILLP